MPYAQILVNPVRSRLIGNLDRGILHFLDLGMSFAHPGAKYAKEKPIDFSNEKSVKKAMRIKNWDGRTHLLTHATHEFSTGLLSRMQSLLTQCHVSFDVVDNRDVGATLQYNPMKIEHTLRDYQRYSIDVAKASRLGIIRAATGAGKTRIALGLMSEIERPALFLVTQRSLMYQAADVFKELLFFPETVGMIGDGHFDPRFITVATIQSLCAALGISVGTSPDEEGEEDEPESSKALAQAHAFEGVIQACLSRAEVVIVDEVQHVAAQTSLEIISKATRAAYRFGLSATDWRDDGQDMLIEAACGPRIVNISLSMLVKSQVLVPAEIRTVLMAVHEHGDYKGAQKYVSVYKYFYVNNGAFHHQTVDINDKWLREGLTVLTLVTSVKHGQILERMHHERNLPAVFLSGSSSTAERQQVLADVREGRLKHLIATSIADEGLDLPRLDALNLAGGGKSSTRAYQRIGRILRPSPGKTLGRVVDYRCPDHKFFETQFRRRLEIYKQEPAFTVL